MQNQIVFAGFNALTGAEEKIISYFVERHAAKVFWDIDTYYVHNNTQEAGRFFRAYQRHDVLGATFPPDVASNFMKGVREIIDPTGSASTSTDKIIRIYGAAEPVSQAKVMSQILQEKLQEGLNPEETLIVLPDEKLLLPVLHGLSGAFEKINVTMGFPLSNTPIFSIAELLVDLQISRRQDHFNHREVLALLGHPYVVAADAIAANVKRKEILSHNWVHIPRSYLATTLDLHRRIFQEVSAAAILDYLRDIITEIGQLDQISALDKEYAFNFLKLLNRMDEVIGSDSPQGAVASKKGNQLALKSFLRLLRQLIQTYKIPFTGEPLRGLQIMGVLETRNLDYKNVFILSMNEGAIPSSTLKGSYIPFNIRKAYGLPTVEHQDAIYAYLFYRVLQRAENIHLFYNSETDVLGQGEMSRYLQQLIYESGLKIEKRILHNPLQPRPITPITIPKTPEVLEALSRLNEGNGMFRGISPSALNNYVECRLRFYLRHVAGIKEPREVEEDLDARVLGNFLHRVMELLYNGIRERKGTKLVEAADLKNTDITLDLLIDQAFIEKYRLEPGAPVEYEGQRLVVREIVKRFAKRIIEMDKIYAPFTLEATEQGGLFHSIQLQNSNVKVLLNGKIDRIDRKGDILRVIDYKTGKDQLDFESIPSLFARDEKRNKAAFQTMLYALLYKSSSIARNEKIVPGLINRINLFDKDFKFGFKVDKEYLDDVTPLLAEFEQHMTILLEELFSPDVPFDQTTDIENCKYCAFKGICYRN
jgi:CRISPR/Cas system-associated exonuclease Cas4 (RecB family)